jgi:hypothetical protein
VLIFEDFLIVYFVNKFVKFWIVFVVEFCLLFKGNFIDRNTFD